MSSENSLSHCTKKQTTFLMH